MKSISSRIVYYKKNKNENYTSEVKKIIGSSVKSSVYKIDRYDILEKKIYVYGKWLKLFDKYDEKYDEWREVTINKILTKYMLKKRIDSFPLFYGHSMDKCKGFFNLFIEYIPNGCLLEKWVCNKKSHEEWNSFLFQLGVIIYFLSNIAMVSNSDINTSNIFICKVPEKEIKYKIGKSSFSINNEGIKVIMIDFGKGKIGQNITDDIYRYININKYIQLSLLNGNTNRELVNTLKKYNIYEKTIYRLKESRYYKKLLKKPNHPRTNKSLARLKRYNMELAIYETNNNFYNVYPRKTQSLLKEMKKHERIAYSDFEAFMRIIF